MTEEPTAPSWDRWYKLATSFVAPASFVVSLLFYFGYVASRAEYSYFGIDVDTLGLSTRDYVMRSPQALLVPGLLLLLLGAATAALLAGFRSGHIGPRATRVLARVGALIGAAGLALVFAYSWLGDWTGYALLTPLVITAGVGLLAVAGRFRGFATNVVALLVLVAAVSTFWATATLAQWTGRGIAENTARHLDDLPAVVLDTHERLYLRDDVTQEQALVPTGADRPPAGQTFRYRYYGLRLLVQSGDLMFLVPERWDPSDSTLVFAMSDVRIKYRFVDQRP